MPLQNDPAEGTDIYECVDCQRHVEDPDDRLCECGGYLRHIGVPRPE